MQCKQVFGLLNALVDDELNRFQAGRVKHHLQKCSTCQQEWESIQQWSQEAASWREVSVPAGLQAKVTIALQQAPRTTQAPEWSLARPARRVGLLRHVAAAMALGAGLIAGYLVVSSKAPVNAAALYQEAVMQLTTPDSMAGMVEVEDGERQIAIAFQLKKPSFYRVQVMQLSSGLFHYSPLGEERRTLPGEAQVFQIGDGKTHWTYYPRRKKYLKLTPQVPGLENLAYMGLPFFAGMPGFEALLNPRQKPSHFGAVTTAIIHGQRCYALPMEYQQEPGVQYTVYLDFQTHKPVGWRRINGAQVISGHYWSLNGNDPAPEKFFQWTPPKEATPYLYPTSLLAVGTEAPHFTLPMLNGEKLSLEEELPKHKATLLFFWTHSYMGNGKREEVESLAKLSQELQGQGVQVIGVSSSTSQATLGTFLGTVPITFPFVMDTRP